MVKTKNFTVDELDCFREFQRRSSSILVAEAENVRPGMTEQEEARCLRKSFYIAVRSTAHTGLKV